MTLISEIIRDAYRESNLIAINADPTADEQTEGLRLLNRIISGMYGDKAGEELLPLIVGRNNISRPNDYPGYQTVPEVTDWFVPSNARLILNLEEALTVYLDPNPEDGARFAVLDKSANLATYNLTVNGNGRTIASATSVTLSTSSVAQEYFYRADTGDWSLLSPLVAADTFPFPAEFEDLFVIRLAIRLNPRNGVALDELSVSTHNELSKKFRSRYRQHKEVGSELGLLHSTVNRLWRFYDTRSGNSDFTFGHPRGPFL